MKEAKDILYRAGLSEVIGNTAVPVISIDFDSRCVKPDGMFVAVKGTQTDGHDYIERAINSGALMIVCENLPDILVEGVHYYRVADSALALGIIASNFYDVPSLKLKLVGVTGTNGKTTIASLLFETFEKLGYRCGLLSTVVNRISQEEIPATHTTPDPLALNALLSQMVEAGCEYCFMEVSSHSVVQNRIAGLVFQGGIFTNLTHDHLDFHGTFDAYLKAKQEFFTRLPASAFALTNLDDRNGMIMVQNTRAKVYTYGLKSLANYHGRILESRFDGMMLQVNQTEVWTRLTGEFNASNFMAIFAAATLLDQDMTDVLSAMSEVKPVDGRFETLISPEGIIAIVDYAHTPDAVKNVLATINSIRTHNEKLLTVIGAGGNRDTTKRPVMAQIAARLSERVILTSDNPRSEKPEDIIDQMRAGVDPVDFKKVLTITNRREAIIAACAMAQPGDIILVAGKGHEKYQEIQGVKHHFDDKEILCETLNIIEK